VVGVDPFRLVKEPDQATPKLLLAFVGSEVLTIEIKWMRPLAGGGDEHYFTVRLEGARITEVHSAGDVTVAGGVLESAELVYTKITLRDEINGTVATIMP
jgi:type VI secretion system Hcp family effector